MPYQITYIWDYIDEASEDFGQVILTSTWMPKFLSSWDSGKLEPWVVGWSEPFWPNLNADLAKKEIEKK